MGHLLGAPDLLRGRRRQRAAVSTQHDIGIEDGEQRIEVALAAGGEKRPDHLPLTLEVSVRGRDLAPHAPPGAAGELPGRGRGLVDDRCDLVKGHTEDVVQHERQPLGRVQRVSSTTCSASPTESAKRAACSGSVSASRLTIGSGTCTSDSSRLTLRLWSMFRQTRATTVGQPAAQILDLTRLSNDLKRTHAS